MFASKSRALAAGSIATALATLLVISILGFQDWRRYDIAYHQIRQQRRVLSLNETLLGHLRDVETGQRGFLLTGQDLYLAPYRTALMRLPVELNELDGLISGDPAQRARVAQIRTLMTAKLLELGKTIELAQSHHNDEALAVVRTNQGQHIMDDIRKASQGIEAAETARWQTAWDALNADAARLRTATISGAALLVVLVGLAAVALRRSTFQTDRLIVQLEESNTSAVAGRELLRATLYSIGDGVITTDREGRVQMMNTVAERLTGYREVEARGVLIEEIVHIVNEATREQVRNPIRRVIEEGKVVGLANHTVLISKSGGEIPVDDTAAPIETAGGAVNGVILVFRDVSERKKAFDLAHRMAAIVEHSDDAMVAKTLDGTVTAWNRGAERLFGYSDREMIGSPISRVIPPDRLDEMKNILHAVAQGRSFDHHETERVTKDGQRIRVSLTVSPIRDDEGRVVGASKIARDITRQRHLEDLIRQAQKMEAVGRLAGGLAHDFNNLLTVILGYAAALRTRLERESPLQTTVAEIIRAGERAASLTGQLLTFSRKQVSQPKVQDLNILIGQTRDMLERMIGEDIDLTVLLSLEPCPARVDSGQLTQILMNLAANARDAMPTGGKLTIESSTVVRAREDLGRRGIRPAGRFVRMAVTDTGEGMDAETQSHIFEPFFTTKEEGKGTGLGLATVFGIVAQHDGWLDVYSEKNLGTTFTIHFPYAESAETEVPAVPKEVFAARPANILLVEDQAAIRMLGEDVLSDAGHLVMSASNGRAALELVQQRGKHIDLLVTDVVMPEMSGPELADRLMKLQPGLIVLYVSGYPDHALLQRGAIEQGTAFLQKPFLPEALIAKVNELLREQAITARASD
jgi:two-component system, cell cycle sensor histidine kinase and response regulator CckA